MDPFDKRARFAERAVGTQQQPNFQDNHGKQAQNLSTTPALLDPKTRNDG